MTLKDIIKNIKWKNVKKKLLELYPEETNNLFSYEHVWSRIVNLTPIKTNLNIIIDKVEDIDKYTYYMVSGWDGKQKLGIEFISWREWLGCEISDDTIVKFSYEEIISHCLFEMTFISFNEDEIQKELEYLNELINKIDGNEIDLVKLNDNFWDI